MKDILFLDLEGVLLPFGEKASHTGNQFNKECVAHLKELLAARPHVEVVFSTSWRIGLLKQQLIARWMFHDLPLDRILGYTPDSQDWLHLKRVNRGREILQWYYDHKPRYRIRKYAILDDVPTTLTDVHPSHTLFITIPEYGLDRRMTDRLLSYFSIPKT